MNLDAPELIRMQIALEYQLDSNVDLVPIPGSEEQARFILYRHAQGYERFFRHDLSVTQRALLDEMEPGLVFEDPSIVASILGLEIPTEGMPVFASGVIRVVPGLNSTPLAVFGNGCWVIEVEGSAVAWAWSIRSNTRSAELAVEVDPEYRRRGYGRRVTVAWAQRVLESGQVPFYSYRSTNLPSQALARSMGVEVFAHCIAFG